MKKKCRLCGREIHAPTPSQFKKRKYCSKKCADIANVAKRRKKKIYLICKNCGKRFVCPPYQVKRREVRFDEFAKFFHACDTIENKAFFRVLAVTGMRTGELAKRKWEDLDMESRRLTITGTKTGSARVTFLGEHSLALLMEHWAVLGYPRKGPVFPPVFVVSSKHGRPLPCLSLTSAEKMFDFRQTQ